MNSSKKSRIAIAIACLLGLVAVFIFQRIDLAHMVWPETAPIHRFLINRTIRFLLNDALAIGLIYALFVEKKYVIFSLWVQLVGFFLFLVPYFILKLYFPSYNGPLISFLHRLILNPTLLLLLIPAFYYQRQRHTHG
jgi:exosortase F-associated protein